MSRESYRTLAAPVRHEEPKVKGSRFLATLAPVATREEAEALVQRVRKELHDARHTCFAYRLGPDARDFRSSDDGEPSGSAGKPMLAQLEGAELTDVVAVVTRWFGGTKLGVGGLVRAYGGAVAAALERAEVREVVLTERVVVRYPYVCTGAVEPLLASFGLRPVESEWGADARLVLDVPIARVDALLDELRERTAGRARAERG